MGYLRWAPNVTGEKMEITFFPDRGSNPVRWTQSPTLYHVAIKAGLYRKAVQVCYIPIPGDIMVLSCYLLYGYTGCRKHINPDFVYKESRFGKLLPEEYNFPKVPRHSLVPHLSCSLRSNVKHIRTVIQDCLNGLRP